MARDWNKFILSSQDTILSAKVKLLYPSLFKPQLPQGEKDESKARYQVTLLVPKTADVSVFKNAVDTLIADKLTEKQRKETKLKKPFLKTEDQPKIVAMLEKAGLDPADFPIIIRANAKFKPIVKAANMDDVTDEEQVYSGRWACVSLRPYWFDHPTGGKGVSAGLGNVQLLDHDDVLSGGRIDANKEFEAVDGAGDGKGASGVFDD